MDKASSILKKLEFKKQILFNKKLWKSLVFVILVVVLSLLQH